ncbi:hypothetical protein R50072_03040 [Simiduia litorea]|uniref:hypothetical protein n=1 Tax=Simiduia litorea TaxID=1435348 RepID=UPI0036F2072E
MIRVVSFLLCIFIFLFSAGNVNAEQGWITDAKVTKIVAVVNGGINVRITPELTACTSQSGYGVHYASIYPDHPGKENMLAILLAAYMADKTVAIYLSDDTCKVYEVELGGR